MKTVLIEAIRATCARCQGGLWRLAVFLVVWPIAGCGQVGPEIVSVTGKVTVNGEVVEGAALEFVVQGDGPDEHGTGVSPSYGKTDSNGHYEMYFTRQRKGVMPGPCLIKFRSDERIRVGEKWFQGKEVFPRKFNDQTDIERTVEPGKRNVIDFDLKLKL